MTQGILDSRALAEKIYNCLKENGAGIGNASILLIEQVLDDYLSSTPPAEQKGECIICGKQVMSGGYCPDINCDGYMDPDQFRDDPQNNQTFGGKY